ncbi:esterase-like activity of phytase family protein [Jiella sonneratiae]|uniref:Esterase-like activity of phytase family protein n=1 Tax=Jiella sonneratiae TaxID=2816856 RepID=A0ABS3J6N0_9HYPH|nr:esterase-like activity of phytase family protein [Jiella sonneratiae]MBO0905326.1 esterase-like activity of phytase family protein [Jiella sonneratiae]
MRRRVASLLLAGFLAVPLASRPAGAGAGDAIAVDASLIPQFSKHSQTARFGRLTYLGGFSFWSPDGRLHGISAIRLREKGAAFVAVTDNGCRVEGRITRDAGGRPLGLSGVEVTALTDLVGRPLRGKAAGDAESLALAPDGRTAYVGFEQRHRIWAYDLSGTELGRARSVPLPVPARELRANKGLEMLAIAPQASPLNGAMVTVAEHSIDPAGNLFAGIAGEDGGVFKVRRNDGWEVSDGDFLPNGDLLLLERRFEGIFSGLGIRIRRIAGDAIRPGALVDGPVVFEADLSDEIDNMEGLDVWLDGEGRTRLTLVSDDNGSLFQRNILLEFVWTDGDDPAPGLASGG